MAFLNKISNYGDSTISPIIQDNMIEHFDWGFMDAGGFVNVEIPHVRFIRRRQAQA